MVNLDRLNDFLATLTPQRDRLLLIAGLHGAGQTRLGAELSYGTCKGLGR